LDALRKRAATPAVRGDASEDDYTCNIKNECAAKRVRLAEVELEATIQKAKDDISNAEAKMEAERIAAIRQSEIDADNEPTVNGGLSRAKKRKSAQQLLAALTSKEQKRVKALTALKPDLKPRTGLDIGQLRRRIADTRSTLADLGPDPCAVGKDAEEKITAVSAPEPVEVDTDCHTDQWDPELYGGLLAICDRDSASDAKANQHQMAEPEDIIVMGDTWKAPERFDADEMRHIVELLSLHGDGIRVTWPHDHNATSAHAKMLRWNTMRGCSTSRVATAATSPSASQAGTQGTASSSSSDQWTGGMNSDGNLRPVPTASSSCENIVTAGPPKNSRVGERQQLAESRKRKEEAMETAKRARLLEVDQAAELGSELQQAMRAQPSRAGERRRQAERKRQREEAARAEEAAKRRRVIVDSATATTAAQRIMARLKQRVTAREGALTHADTPGDK
jgi:hypothetical protein